MSDSGIPLDICLDIFLRTPAESLLRFRAVCKQWRSLIDGPCFVKAHTLSQLSSNTLLLRSSTSTPFYPLYYFDFEALNFADGTQTIPVTPMKLSARGMSRLPALQVAACNGLMLVVPVVPNKLLDNEMKWNTNESLEIWNPLTHERLKLPQPKLMSNCVLGVGLGYDCEADDYKVVVISLFFNEKWEWQTHVYSLKSDSWRKITDCPFRFWIQGVQHGVYLNGALHWVSDNGILALDVGSEKYRQLAVPHLPKKPESKLVVPMQLAALGGYLFLSYYCGRHYMDSFDVWVMNDDYGGKDGWTKLFALSRRQVPSGFFHRHQVSPVAYMENERRVLLHDQNSNVFLWFDMDTDSVKAVSIHGIGEYSRISAQICEGSLLQLHKSCGRAASKRRMSRREMMEMADTKLTFCVRDVYKYAGSNKFSSPWEEGQQVLPVSVLNSDGDPTLIYVPLDIYHEIFLQLPAKSVIRFRAVCKAYRDIIDDPLFIKAFTIKQISSKKTILVQTSTGPPTYPLYSFDLECLHVTDRLQTITATPHVLSGIRLSRLQITVCNGLILFAGRNKWEIWNPSSDERLELPRGDFHFNPNCQPIGFGCEYATDDYKAVVVDYIWRRRQGQREKVHRTHVYSLRSDSWRIMSGNCVFDDLSYPRGPGVFVSGALNWLSTELENNKIIALDLGTESYQQLGLPPFPESEIMSVGKRYLDVLDGCLIMGDDHIGNDDDNKHFDVWMMKDYGVEGSWVKLFSIKKKPGVYRHLRPVVYMREKTEIFLQDDYHGFFLFNIESGSIKKVGIHGESGSIKNLHARCIPGSIFRLHDNCGISTQRKRVVKASNTDLNLRARLPTIHMTVVII